MIAYEVPTVARVPGRLLSAWDAGAPCPPVARVPVPHKDLPHDALVRLRRLAYVVDLARQQLVQRGGFRLTKDSANTLKVFLVPEFYFRPPLAACAEFLSDTYSFRARNKILDALDVMFRHADFTDWLLACGTVMWNDFVSDVRPGQTRTPIYFNTAVLVRGGPLGSLHVGDPLGSLHVVEKKVPSNIDGVPQATFSDGSTANAGPANDPQLKPFFESWKNRKNQIVDVSGVSVGLEICLDHANDPRYRVLRSVVRDWKSQTGQKQRGVQLHILTAGGMPADWGSVAARAGGYLLRNDGLSPPPSQLLRAVTWITRDPLLGKVFLDGPQHHSAYVSERTSTPPTFAVGIPAGPPCVPTPPGGKFPIGKQQIAFYPAKSLP